LKGFYWDITDWAENVDSNDLENNQMINYEENDDESSPINSGHQIDVNVYNDDNRSECSPIYSKVFKSKLRFCPLFLEINLPLFNFVNFFV
jgi:hypothetical protein